MKIEAGETIFFGKFKNIAHCIALWGGKSLLEKKFLVLKEIDWCTCLVKAEIDTDIESLAHSLVAQGLPERHGKGPQTISMLHKYLEQSHKE